MNLEPDIRGLITSLQPVSNRLKLKCKGKRRHVGLALYAHHGQTIVENNVCGNRAEKAENAISATGEALLTCADNFSFFLRGCDSVIFLMGVGKS